MARHQAFLLVCLMTVAGWHAAVAQRGFVPIKPIDHGPPPPPSATCGADCCPSNQICICGGCFPENGPFPACAFPDPSLGIVMSCCDDPDTQCNRCNRECCLGDDVCSCKGTCIEKGELAPTCGPEDYDFYGFPTSCCETKDTGPRCSKLAQPVPVYLP